MSEGDIHIWKPGTTPLEAECGYTQEARPLMTTEFVDGEEVEVEASEVEIVVPEPTGLSCDACLAAVTPPVDEEDDADPEE